MDRMNMNPPAQSQSPIGMPRPEHDQQNNQGPQGPEAQSRTLWIGDVEPWMNEHHIAQQFNQIATVTSVKLIRDKARQPVGYGFVEFPDFQTARDVFHSLNGKKIPGGSNKCFKLNWASHGGGVARAQPQVGAPFSNPMIPPGPPGNPGGPPVGMTPPQHGSNMMGSSRGGYGGGGGQGMGGRMDYGGGGGHQSGPGGPPGGGPPQQQQTEGYQIYVGDLHTDVTNPIFLQTFKQVYPSCFEAKVICDPVTRQSKGYGFIKFGQKEESERALQEMQGKIIMGRPIKMNYASQRNRNASEQNGSMNRYGSNMNPMGGGPPGGGMNQGGHMGGNMPGLPHLQNQHSGGQYGGGMNPSGGYGLNQYGAPPQNQHAMPPGGGLGGPIGHQPYGLPNQMPPHNSYGQGMGGYGGSNPGISGGLPPQGMGMRDMNPHMQNASLGSTISPYGGGHQSHSVPGQNVGQSHLPNHQPNQYHPGQQHGAPQQPHSLAPNSNQIGGQIDQYGHMGNGNRDYGHQPQIPDGQIPKNIQSPSYQPNHYQNGSLPPSGLQATNSPLKSGDLGSVGNQTLQQDKSYSGNPNEINMHQVNQSANTVTYDPLDVNPVSPLDPAATSPPNHSLNPSANGQEYLYAGYQQQPQPIKSKLPIAPLSQEDIDSMNKEYLEPLVNNGDALFII